MRDTVSFNGRRTSGFGLAAPTAFEAGDVFEINFQSDKPVTPQQFFTFVARIQPDPSMPVKILSFMPIDETHFRATAQMLSSGLMTGPGYTQIVDGIKFTITDVNRVASSKSDEDSKKLSAGAMVGIGVAGAAALGGIVWAATRKKSRQRRRK